MALLCCAAASELDDYDTCWDVLSATLQQVARASGSEAGLALLRAALLQQRALRRLDSGQSPDSDALAVVRLLQANAVAVHPPSHSVLP